MAKNTGLGKGLNALFGDVNTVQEDVKKEEKIKKGEVIEILKINEVEPNRNQPRKQFDEEALEDLAESIKQHGVIQPIIVTKKDDYYEIVAGERRWRASKKAGNATVPAIVRQYDDRKNKEIALIENIQREDLNAIEKAQAIKLLMEEHALTQQQVADILGKSRSGIANTIRILNLCDEVKQLALDGKITEGHCRQLLLIEDPEKQYEMALHIIKTGGTVRDIEKKMQVKKKIKPERKHEAIYRDIETSFQGFFGTKVKINPGKRAGKIVIEYSTQDELERLLDIVK